MNNKTDEAWREEITVYWRYWPIICLKKNRGKSQSLRVADISVEIRSEYLQNTSLSVVASLVASNVYILCIVKQNSRSSVVDKQYNNNNLHDHEVRIVKKVCLKLRINQNSMSIHFDHDFHRFDILETHYLFVFFTAFSFWIPFEVKMEAYIYIMMSQFIKIFLNEWSRKPFISFLCGKRT